MSTTGFALANIILISRLPAFVENGPVKKHQVFFCWIFQLISFFTMVNWMGGNLSVWVGIILVILHGGIHFAWWWSEGKAQTNGGQYLHLCRISSALVLILLAFTLASPFTGLGVYDFKEWALVHQYWFFPLKIIGSSSGGHILITLFCLLLCTNEATSLIRFFIESLKLKPNKKSSKAPNDIQPASLESIAPIDNSSLENNANAELMQKTENRLVDDQEYKFGRNIGILERLAIFFFVINGQYTAIAFVLTAKSMARFKELDNDRNFAEYFLLGTMLSVVTAGLLALLEPYFQKVFL